MTCLMIPSNLTPPVYVSYNVFVVCDFVDSWSFPSSVCQSRRYLPAEWIIISSEALCILVLPHVVATIGWAHL